MSNYKDNVDYALKKMGYHAKRAGLKSASVVCKYGLFTLAPIAGLSSFVIMDHHYNAEKGSVDTYDAVQERTVTEDFDAQLKDLESLAATHKNTLTSTEYIIEQKLETYTEEDQAALDAYNTQQREIGKQLFIEQSELRDDILLSSIISEKTFADYAKKFNKLSGLVADSLPTDAHRFHDECRIASIEGQKTQDSSLTGAYNTSDQHPVSISACMQQRERNYEFISTHPGPLASVLIGFMFLLPLGFIDVAMRFGRNLDIKARRLDKPTSPKSMN